jgi:RNA polymerase sigma-70 factor, ECF subfamily
VRRDVKADSSGLYGLRAAVAVMAASAVPRQPGIAPRASGLARALSESPPPAAPRTAGASGGTAGSAYDEGACGGGAHQNGAGGNGSAPSGGRAGAQPDPERRGDRAKEAESLRMLALVQQAQDGDGEAFGKLYDVYSDTVFRYIYYRVSNRSLAEDLTSETFLRALRRISTFTWQGRDFGAWLVTIARNLVADHFKSSRYRLEVSTGEMLDSDETEPSPEESVLASLSNRALLDAVHQLNAQQQECVTLRFLQGLSVAETAKIMGKNDGAIKTLQYRAIRTLARLLPSDLR